MIRKSQLRWLRNFFLSVACACALDALPASLCAAQDTSTGSASGVELANPFQADDVDAAIDRGLQYLLSKQREDGSISEGQHDTAMTALGIMALASAGHVPADRSDRGQAVERALAFVLRDDRQDKDGYFGNKDGSRMYGHGIVTLMLTEMLGMGADEQQDDLIREKCQRAIDLILSAQQQTKQARDYRGGWRYTPNAPDSDLSVSVWQLMSLRSAKNDGLSVPNEAIDDALGYLDRSFSTRNSRPNEGGGFSYLPEQNNPTFTMTAAGLLAMQVCGQYDAEQTRLAADWLRSHPPKWEDRFIFYGTYYFAQGMYQRGGEYAEEAERLVRELLLPKQAADGAWEAAGGEEKSAGKIYATSMSVLSLSVKHHYLPIYQR